jgi:NAD(P)-dependent dehydrogenase (short-subunit alcohol dehydrogenase family)
MPSNQLQSVLVDPREAGPKPPYDYTPQSMPGSEQAMQPRADHGEQSYNGCDRLKGTAALITGADSGIGRAVAIAFAREGADVLISYLNEHHDAEETAALVRQAGRKAVTVPGDITSEQHCERLVDRATQEFGALDILVSNAAMQTVHQQVDEWNSEEFDRTYRTNVYAMFYLCRAAIQKMRSGGSILATTSVQAFQPTGQLLAYSSTKGAIRSFIQAISELAIKKGIRANGVAPGPVWTPLIPSTMPQEKVKQFGKQTLIGRAAQPAELAPAYVFLASNDARYITGSILDVTGGEMIPDPATTLVCEGLRPHLRVCRTFSAALLAGNSDSHRNRFLTREQQSAHLHSAQYWLFPNRTHDAVMRMRM